MEEIFKAIMLAVMGFILVGAWFRAKDGGHDGSGWAFIALCMFIGSCEKLLS